MTSSILSSLATKTLTNVALASTGVGGVVWALSLEARVAALADTKFSDEITSINERIAVSEVRFRDFLEDQNYKLRQELVAEMEHIVQQSRIEEIKSLNQA